MDIFASIYGISISAFLKYIFSITASMQNVNLKSVATVDIDWREIPCFAKRISIHIISIRSDMKKRQTILRKLQQISDLSLAIFIEMSYK